jgi:Uma2 family endonuclease
MKSFLKNMLQSPDFPDFANQISQIWADEKRRRAEFLEKVTEDDKAEFINGKAIFHGLASEGHNAAIARLATLLNAYAASRNMGEARVEKAMISLTRNDYEPDICFFGAEKLASLKIDTTRYPTPDVIVEVLSPTTQAIDRGVKFEDYAKHSIPEYWLIDPDKEIFEQYLLANHRYELAMKSSNGLVRSNAIEGFEVPIRALFDRAEFQAAQRKLIA